MAQIKKAFDEVRIPFTKMSFTPDVPSTQLGPNEYNDGLNVETDVRGIRSMAGDEEIMRLPCPGTPTYISGGFRQDDRFWTVVATDEGKWWASTGGTWWDITPPTPIGTYTQNQNITEGWNGTIPFFNDEKNPPMFWPEDQGPRFATTGASSTAGTSTITFLPQTDTLSGVRITGVAGQFSYTSGENIRAGMKMKLSGSIITPTFTLSGVTIANTDGEFHCAATQLAIGQRVVISGTYGGTGSITGYTDPTTYYIVATNGTTEFSLSTTPYGNPVVTTAGTPTGLTYTVQQPALTGVAVATTTGWFTCSVTSLTVGQRVDIAGTAGGTGSIVGYSNPSSYFIVATNGATTFQLSLTPGGAPITTTVGTLTGLTYSQAPYNIVGYTDPTTYFVKSANGNSTFTLSATYGGPAITTIPGNPQGLTFLYSPFAIGETIAVNSMAPVGFNGLHTVTGVQQGSVSFAGTTVGPQTRSGTVGIPFPKMIMYSNNVPSGIANIEYVDETTQKITLDAAVAIAPYSAGEFITISDVNQFYNGTFEVVSSDTTTITYLAQPGAVYPGFSVGSVAPEYSWNYNPNWSKVFAKFMRLYNTPNVGCILVAGDLTATNATTGETEFYPVTVQWSQSFGLNQAPRTWTPTVINIANQLEVPLRGEALDAFPCNGQLFLCSYWDTVVFSPINYTTTSAPILGVRLFNQGRGLLSSNCWGNTDKMVYGIDARDIWVFNGQDFQGLGNQRVKNWFYDQLDPNYVDRVFMQVNSQRNQIEIYYPTTEAINGVPNKMLSYRYDLDCWNAPRDVSSATSATETPVRLKRTDDTWAFNKASRTVMYARGVADQYIVQKDQGYSFINDEPIESRFRRDNIKLLPDYSGKLMVHRVLPEIVNLDNAELPINPVANPELIGSVSFKVEGANSVGQEPQSTISQGLATNTDNPWIQLNQNAFRVNTLEAGNTSNTTLWMLSASTWQYTQVEDDR